jgi:uncharacterized protein
MKSTTSILSGPFAESVSPQCSMREVGATFEVRSSNIHGRGAFACVGIPAGTMIVDYVGERITKAESLRRCELGNEFIFALDEDFDLDGAVEWNPARFLNHSCSPNCEAWHEEGRIILGAIHDISAGTELTFNYGYDLADFREHPCNCGSPDCVGFIVSEEFIPGIRHSSRSVIVGVGGNGS